MLRESLHAMVRSRTPVTDDEGRTRWTRCR